MTVFEKGRDVGGRFHGDFQGLENWSQGGDVIGTLERLGVKADFLCRPVHGGGFYNPDLRRLDVSSDAPLFYLVRRGGVPDSLDTSLKRQALEAGAEVRFGERRRAEDADIIATGPRGARVVASGILFETDMPDHACGILNDDLAPKGYAYLLVAGGQGTLASVLYERFSEAKTCLERSTAAFRGLYGFEVRHPRAFGGYGGFEVPVSAVEGGRRVAGEAAGFQDFLFGFGIRHAMVSGALAAESLASGADYDALWQREIGPALRASWRNRMLFERFGRAGYNLLIRGTSRRPRGFLRRLYGGWPLGGIVHPLVERLRPL